MRIYMPRWLISLGILAIVACAAPTAEDEGYGSGFVVMSEKSWDANYDTPYPFTVPNGEISCGSHPVFGREVYFEPKGFTDESYIGTPLNRSAVNALEQSHMSPNVPYSIKKGADLSDAIKIGLEVCDEQRDIVKNRPLANK